MHLSLPWAPSFLLLALLDEVGEVALAAVVPVEVHGHEDARPADLVRALAAQARHLVVAVHLVELEHCELHLLALVLDLLGLGVRLLLALLAAALELEVREEGGLLGQAVHGAEELGAVAEGAAAEDEALLGGGDAVGGADLLLEVLGRDIYIYIYTLYYIYTHTLYIYIYIYRERERQRERTRNQYAVLDGGLGARLDGERPPRDVADEEPHIALKVGPALGKGGGVLSAAQTVS